MVRKEHLYNVVCYVDGEWVCKEFLTAANPSEVRDICREVLRGYDMLPPGAKVSMSLNKTRFGA